MYGSVFSHYFPVVFLFFFLLFKDPALRRDLLWPALQSRRYCHCRRCSDNGDGHDDGNDYL